MTGIENPGQSNDNPGQIRPVIFQGELDYIYRCILDCPNIETGGELFGYFTESGVPVVMYAIGPGKNANHETAFFNQDLDYLVRTGREIKNLFGLRHIGEWHSHHNLGLSHPSSHDERTMVSTIRNKKLGQFLLCIGNCRRQSATLNPFLCNDAKCTAVSWDIIPYASPVRRPLDRMMENILVHPHIVASDNAFKRDTSSATPEYPEGYWLEDKSNNLALHNIFNYVKGHHGPDARMNVRMDNNGIVHILTHKESREEQFDEDIRFPYGFPEKAPEVVRHINNRRLALKNSKWVLSRQGLITSFVNYYTNL